MGFKEVNSLDADRTTALGGIDKKTGKKNPTKEEGYYLGSRKVESRKGTSNIYFLQTPEGTLGIWGKTDLDRKMLGATLGAMVRITQSGMVKTPNGDMYKFKVEQDLDNTIEVSEVSESSSSSSNSSDEESYESEDSDSDYESDDSSNLVAADARAAKVKELLAKSRKN